MSPIAITAHDRPDADALDVIDRGLGQFNDESAALHEVQGIACVARTDTGQVVGGAVGRWWGTCCELQQLWVAPQYRRQGLGAGLVARFEGQARHHGCQVIYLETFSFQAPRFYHALGYETELVRSAYPHGVSKRFMAKRLEIRG